MSILYCIAIQKNISDKAARRFKTNIVQFKFYYRVAKTLFAVVEETINIDKSDNKNTADKKKNNKKKKKKKKI